MSLLIFTPAYREILPEVVEAVEAERGRANGCAPTWAIGRENPWPAPDKRNVTAQYRKAWSLALDVGADALLTIEHDIRIPPGAIERLLATDADVVYGVYVFRTWPVVNAWRYINARNLGMSLTNYPAVLAQMRKAGQGKVSGIGFGCTLIRRNVLERTQPRDDTNGNACDIPFAEDCVRMGLRQVARFDVLCGHWTGKRWVTPFEREAMDKYQAVVTINAMANGRFMRLKPGLIVNLTEAEASDLVRAGYVMKVGPAQPEVSLPAAQAEPPALVEQEQEADQSTAPTVSKTRRKKVA